jgi:hypothetical protein
MHTPESTYERPQIESRAPVSDPLIGNASPVPLSAAFRTAVGPAYKPPRVEERTKLEGALQVLNSGTPS